MWIEIQVNWDLQGIQPQQQRSMLGEREGESETHSHCTVVIVSIAMIYMQKKAIHFKAVCIFSVYASDSEEKYSIFNWAWDGHNTLLITMEMYRIRNRNATTERAKEEKLDFCSKCFFRAYPFISNRNGNLLRNYTEIRIQMVLHYTPISSNTTLFCLFLTFQSVHARSNSIKSVKVALKPIHVKTAI